MSISNSSVLSQMTFLVIGLTMALAVWLIFGLRFDPKLSPDWQFVPYCLMLLCILAMPVALGMQNFFSWMGRAQLVLPSLMVLALGTTLAVGWAQGGPYSGLRDERLFRVIMISASSSGSVIATLALLQTMVMFVLFLALHFGWQWVLGVPGASWLLPLVSPAEESVEADCSEKSEVQ